MRLVVPILALGVLAGCAALEEGLRAPGEPQGASMGEAVRLNRAVLSEQRAALNEAQELFLRAPSDAARLRLATLLATLPPPLRDDARALELLEPLAHPEGGPAGRYAAFLALHVAERQRLGREIERLAKERAALERDRQMLERERQALDRERDKREEALRQQLEALRAIERGILEREERVRQAPLKP